MIGLPGMKWRSSAFQCRSSSSAKRLLYSSSGWPAAMALRSAPEQKLPPAPVTIADPDVGVLVDLEPGVVHPHEHLGAEGVPLGRSVQRDDGDVAVPLEQQVRRFVGVSSGIGAPVLG